MKHFIFSLLLLSVTHAYAQSYKKGLPSKSEQTKTSHNVIAAENDIADTQIYTFADEMPRPTVDITNFIGEHFSVADTCIYNSPPGKAVINLVVYKDGQIGDLTINRSSGNFVVDQELLRLLRAMPGWKPGIRAGKAVSVRYSLPIVLCLE